MKQFFIQNWRLIAEICCTVCALVFCLVRKKPIKVLETGKATILRLLPGLVNLAEIKYGKGNGSEKLNFVLQELKEILKGMDFGDDAISSYLPFIQEQVEVILSTPQKKVR